jgi:hypothetical protein
MEPHPLHQLPFELLEMVFEYLKTPDLKNLLDLGDRVRDVVIASPISMRKLKLSLMENWMGKVEFIKEFGDCVMDLQFDFCNFEVPDEFRDLMKCMRNIEKLKLSNLHIAAENFKLRFRVLQMKFPKLDNLDLDNSQAMGKLIRLYLKKLYVTRLRLDFSHYNIMTEFTRLLQNQHDLKTLELSGFSNILYQSLFYYDISYTIWFELSRLILNFRVTKDERFFNFLKELTTLEHLEIHKEIETQEFFDIVFQMKNLKSLTLATNFVTLKNIDFKKVTNSNIEELILITRSQYGIEQTINYLTTKLTNLKSLKVINTKTDSSDQMLGFLQLKKLETLHVDNSKLKFIQNIKFENLRFLHLNKLHPFLKQEDWESFFRNHKKIEEIILSDFEVYYVIDNIRAEISKFIYNLHHVEKTLRKFQVHQEMRYQKPVKIDMRISDKKKTLKVSDSFIKFCRDEFHFLRKFADFELSYYADDYLELNNKYLKY